MDRPIDRPTAREAVPAKPHPPQIECLYYFSSETLDIAEAKILGLAADAPPAEVYHWLCYERSTQQFKKLEFKAMDRDKDWHYREFVQAKLYFNTQEARLHLASETEELVLNVNAPQSLPAEFVAKVEQFLASHPSA